MQTLATDKKPDFPWNIVMLSITVSTFALNDLVRKKIADFHGLIVEEKEKIATIHFPILNTNEGKTQGVITAHNMFRDHHIKFPPQVKIGEEMMGLNDAMVHALETLTPDDKKRKTMFVVDTSKTQTAVFVNCRITDDFVIVPAVQPSNPRPGRLCQGLNGKNQQTCPRCGWRRNSGEPHN